MRLLIKRARIIDPAQSLDTEADLLIENGVIAEISPDIPIGGADIIDARGLCLAPGLVDMHVHFRDPGQTHKEDIITGSRAAAAGGFTCICCMPNTVPAADNPGTLRYIVDRARGADAKVCPIAAVTLGQKGAELTDFALLKEHGAVAVSDDGVPVADAAVMRAALISARESGLPLISHCEDCAIVGGGIMHKGNVSDKLGVSGIDRLSEDNSVARDISLAKELGCAVHIAHVSTAGAVERIRAAKKEGAAVTAETAPHYLILTHDKLLTRDANYRMNPPLREEHDRLAVLEGLSDGTIDLIASDHAPHAADEKADFLTAPNGVTGLETAFAVCMTALVHSGRIGIMKLIELMSTAPCRVLGLRGGGLKPGGCADVILFDPNEKWTVDRDRSFSKSRNTPFDGMELTGRIKLTIMSGRITFGQSGEGLTRSARTQPT